MEKKKKIPEHSFVLVAYGKSPFLALCAASLACQAEGEEDCELIIATSTPSEYIGEIARRFGFEYFANPKKNGGIAADWNFALSTAKGKWVTLAHQDDLYSPQYRREILAAVRQNSDAVIAFSDYAELRSGKSQRWNLLLLVKRLLLTPYYLKNAWRSSFWRRRFLAFGNSICCPAVTYNRKKLGKFAFSSDYKVDLDWDGWLRLAEKKGAFVFVPQILMEHRIHEASETSNCIAANRRQEEDLKIFQRLWPDWLACLINAVYQLSTNSNKL